MIAGIAEIAEIAEIAAGVAWSCICRSGNPVEYEGYEVLRIVYAEWMMDVGSQA